MMRRSVKVFGYDLRETLQKKGIDFNLLLTKELLGLDVKLKIDQEGLKPKVNKVNIDFQKEMTLFIANESEKQARYITETNAKEIDLAIRQEQLKISKAFSKEERAIIARNIFINLLDRKDERADLIASQVIGMTESYSRFKEAEIIHDAEIESNGIIIGATKTWWAILDMKTRPEHASADQQMISIKDSFLVAGESLKMPRDPNGSVGNTINCRCVANYDLQETKSFKAISDIDLKPTEEMAKEAERGLKWREEFGRGGTVVGVARANQLKNRENLTPRTIGRMVSFFARHEVDKQAEGFNQGEEGFPSAGRIAWCLTHDTQVLLADGSLKTIGEIVDKKLDIEVIALHKDGLLKPAKIINWLKLESKKEDFLVLRRGLAKSNERGIVDKPKLFATKDHPIYCGKDLGYIKMQDLTNENQVYVVEEYIDEVGEQIIAGHLMGDGSLTKNSQLTISRCEKHKDYLDDTKRLLEHLGFSETREIITKKGFGIGKKQYTSRSKVNHYMKANPMFKIVNKKRVLINDLNKLGSIGLARWIMDDGSLHQKNNDKPSYRIHIEGFTKDSADKIHEFFVNKYGDNVKLHKRENTDGYVLYCGVDATDKIANEIAPYVCDIMKYKLPEHLRKTEYILKNYEPKKTYVSSPQSINYIRNVKKSDGNLQNFKYRYDLTIEDANSFVANGIIVHNCLWGGDAGKSWANRKWAEIKKERDK
jgi:intein/homing endonuclease